MEIKSFKPTRGLLQFAPTTGLVVTGNGASCNTHKVFVLGNIQSMGVEIQSKTIRTLILSLVQELRTTFGKMPNKVVVTSGQWKNRFTAASKCRVAAKIYPTSVLYSQFCFFVRDEHKWAASWQNQQNDCAPSKDSDQLCAQWVPFFTRTAKTDQTGRMPRLIWVFTGRKVHFVGFFMRRLKFMLVSVLHIYQTACEINIFFYRFSIEHTGSIQIHSTFWIFKMSSAIDNPCSGNKKLVFKIKVWQNLRE